MVVAVAVGQLHSGDALCVRVSCGHVAAFRMTLFNNSLFIRPTPVTAPISSSLINEFGNDFADKLLDYEVVALKCLWQLVRSTTDFTLVRKCSCELIL